jgi:hypothetical protein
VPARDRTVGHLQGRWTMIGAAAGCVNVGVRRIEVPRLERLRCWDGED